MKFDLEKMRGTKKVIHCDTGEKARLLLNFLKEKGIHWADNDPTTYWHDEKEKTCYNPNDTFLSYESYDYYIDRDYEVLEFEDVVIYDKPKICEILGVEVDEEFKLQTSGGNIILDNTFYINDNGYLVNDKGVFTPSIGIDLINGNFKLIKLPKWTDEQKEIFKALKTLGYNYIARDSDYSIYAFEKKPVKKLKYYWSSEGIVSFELETDKIMNKPHLNFIDWEDEEPFEIPEV